MSREVFALLNQDGKGIPGSAPLVPAPSPKDTFKEKIGRVIGWDWKPFSHSARSDSLALSHWQKNNDRSTSYSFARFNKARARRLPRPRFALSVLAAASRCRAERSASPILVGCQSALVH
jgi:hypothetical protein